MGSKEKHKLKREKEILGGKEMIERKYWDVMGIKEDFWGQTISDAPANRKT
jgi:hypothetical protein